jgi:RNA polymerase sigma-70 factor (ECF subfamily)
MVFLCCRTLGISEEDSQDVANETFWAAYKGINSFRDHAALSTWLWSIAYRRGVSYLRRHHRPLAPLAASADQLPAGDPPPWAALEAAEQADELWRQVRRLPPLWALCILLFYREDKTVAEIAAIMRLPENTVKTYLFRGRQRLKQVLAAPLETQPCR